MRSSASTLPLGGRAASHGQVHRPAVTSSAGFRAGSPLSVAAVPPPSTSAAAAAAAAAAAGRTGAARSWRTNTHRRPTIAAAAGDNGEGSAASAAGAAGKRRGRPPKSSPESSMAEGDGGGPSSGGPTTQLQQQLQQLQQQQQQQAPRRRTPAEAARDSWRAAVSARDPGYDSVGLVDSLAPDLSDPEWPSKVADWGQWWHGLPTTPRPPQGTRAGGAAGASGGGSRRGGASSSAPAAAAGAGPYWDERDGAEFFATGRLARRRALLEAAARGGAAADADAVAAAAGVLGAGQASSSSSAAAAAEAAAMAADPDAAAFGAEAEAEELVLDLSPFLRPDRPGQEDDQEEDEAEAALLLAEGGYGRTEARRLAALSRAFGSAGVEPSAGEAAALARDRRARGTDADAEAEAFDDAFARESDAFDALRAAAGRRRGAPGAGGGDATTTATPTPLPGNPWGRRLHQELPAALASKDVVRQVGPVRATPGGVRDYWEAPPGGRLLKDPNPRSSLSDLRALAHKRRRRAALDAEWLRMRALRSRGAGLGSDPDYFARDARSAAHVREEEEQGGAPRRWAADEVSALLCGSGAFAPPEVAVPKAAWVLNPLLRADMHGDYCVQHVPTTEQFLRSIGRLFDRGASAVSPTGGGGGGPGGAYARQLHGGPLPNPLVGRRRVVAAVADGSSGAAEEGGEEAFAVAFSAPLSPWRAARLRAIGGEIDAAAGGSTGALARAHARARRRVAEAARAKLERGGRLAPDELAALADEEQRTKKGGGGASGAAAAALGGGGGDGASPSASPSPSAAAASKRRGRKPSARD